MELRVCMLIVKRFRIDSGVRKGCIMSPWLFNKYIWKCDEGGENKEWE